MKADPWQSWALVLGIAYCVWCLARIGGNYWGGDDE